MKNLFSLDGKVAIVTGGRHGLLGPIWTETIEEAGGDVIAYDLPDDVTDKEEIDRFVYDVMGDFGSIDILVNNAAVDNPPGSGASFFGNFGRIMEVNIGGAVNMCKFLIPHMINNEGGVIINVGSIQGKIGADWRNYAAGFEKPVGYNCSKAAMEQLSRSITVQYGRYGIRSACIAFGPYDGGKLSQEFLGKFLSQVPLGKTISKTSVKTTLLYSLCCPELAGQTVLVDAGYTAW